MSATLNWFLLCSITTGRPVLGSADVILTMIPPDRYPYNQGSYSVSPSNNQNRDPWDYSRYPQLYRNYDWVSILEEYIKIGKHWDVYCLRDIVCCHISLTVLQSLSILTMKILGIWADRFYQTLQTKKQLRLFISDVPVFLYG